MRFTEDRVPGLLERAFGRLLLRSARVAAVHRVSDRFRLIDLEGDALQGAAWAAGHKLQVKVAGPFTARTFTPIVFDAVRGHVRLLGYAHGAGPGSDWLRRVQAGDACQVFGPHRSLALGAMGARAQPRCVLTGRAQSIQQARQALKGRGVPASCIVAKAYWAPGKTGMD
jgi:NADPH-dependent ferric siderophore reductase